MKEYEVGVVGLGAMGSACVYALAKAGANVVGFDMYTPPHDQGSTHGESRVIREAYFENSKYVPLVQSAYESWGALQKETGTTLLHQTGGLLIGPKDGGLVGGTRLSGDRFALDYEMLTRREVMRRFPMFHLRKGDSAILDPRAGVLLPDACVSAHLAVAGKLGAELHVNEAITAWRPEEDHVQLQSDQRKYKVKDMVITTGPWLSMFLRDLTLPLTVERQVLYWFEPRGYQFEFARRTMPLYAWENVPGEFFYGFPNLGEGVKVALHHQGVFTNPQDINRVVSAAEIDEMRAVLRQYIPALDGELVKTEVCMYTNTPDEHFIIDRHPRSKNVVVVSSCSGHGFKFAPVIGEIVSDLVRENKPRHDGSMFRIDRFPLEDTLQ